MPLCCQEHTANWLTGIWVHVSQGRLTAPRPPLCTYI